jgi:hypothetical protein
LAHPSQNLAWALELGTKSLNLGRTFTAQSINSFSALPHHFGWPSTSLPNEAHARFNPAERSAVWQ